MFHIKDYLELRADTLLTGNRDFAVHYIAQGDRLLGVTALVLQSVKQSD